MAGTPAAVKSVTKFWLKIFRALRVVLLNCCCCCVVGVVVDKERESIKWNIERKYDFKYKLNSRTNSNLESLSITIVDYS